MGRGRGGGLHISETDTDWSDSGYGGCGIVDRGAQNVARFWGGEYWLQGCVTSAICQILKWWPLHDIKVSISPYTTEMSRNVWQIKRRNFRAAHIQHCTVLGTQSCAKLVTLADTLCGGTNVWLHKMTGKSFIMSPFSASYDPMQDMKIITCLVVYTYEYGWTWIIMFNEVLWFGTSMHHSLINPNQIQMVGIPVSDYPFDKNRKLGISDEKLFTPFSTYGMKVYCDSRVPNQHEIMECTHIYITGGMEWYSQSLWLAYVRTK